VLGILKKSDCRPINKEAKKVDELFKPMVQCLKDKPKLAQKIKTTSQQCVAEAKK
jgi:hypothetical protein